MTTALLAAWGGYSLGELIVFIIVIAAIVGIAYAALQYFGIQIPSIVVKIIGIVLVAALAIICVRFLLSL